MKSRWTGSRARSAAGSGIVVRLSLPRAAPFKPSVPVGRDAGPSNTARGTAFAVMSGGEQRLVRLMATLCPSTRVAWSVSDVGFDERGAAVLHDWLQIVRAQLPDWSYQPSAGGGV